MEGGREEGGEGRVVLHIYVIFCSTYNNPNNVLVSNTHKDYK